MSDDLVFDEPAPYINHSFATRIKGTVKFDSVCRSLNWKQYFRFRPLAGKTIEQDLQCLDLNRFREVQSPEGKSRRFRSLSAFMSDIDAWTRQEVPIAIMGYKNKTEKEQAVAKGLHKFNASMHVGYSFLGGVTMPKLYQAYEMLDPTCMWMCAMVLDDAPVHLYFDFDASFSSNADRKDSPASVLATRVQGQEECVKQEFLSTFEEFFRKTYGRGANWSGLHWETASDIKAGKFSLHAHVITEAFVNIQHMCRFIQAYTLFVDQLYKAGQIMWLQQDDATLLDAGVYTPNRVFRLIGCRKLHKTELRPMPSTEAESLLSWKELVFRGMPSLSIDVEDSQLLSFEASAMHKTKRKRNECSLANDNIVENSPEECPSAEELAVLQRVFSNLHVLGPNAKIAKCRTIRSTKRCRIDANKASTLSYQSKRFQGEFVLQSAWCPNCTHYSPGSGPIEPRIHENTPMAFCVVARGITIMDFRCGTDKKQVFQPNLCRAGISEDEWSALFDNQLIPEPSNARPTCKLSQCEPVEDRDLLIIDSLDDIMADDESTRIPSEDLLQPHAEVEHREELQPSLATIQRIVDECVRQQEGSFADLKMKMQIATVQRDSSAMNAYEQAAASMDASIQFEVVKYLNQFWARFLRLGKPWMVQELGKKFDDQPLRHRWEPSFNSLKHLEEIYSDFNIQLPGYSQLITKSRKGTMINAARLWLNHPASRRLNGIEFNPQKPSTFLRLNDHAASNANAPQDPHDYNLWRGFAITLEAADEYAQMLALQSTTPQQIAEPLLHHIRQVWCRGDDNSFQYVIGWMANIIQKRGKNATALVIKGPQGAGKGIVVQKLGEIIGREGDHFFHAHNIEDVLGTYTHNLRATCLAFLDEVTYGGNHEQAQRLKKLVTESTHSINAKYQPSYTVDSYLNIIIASNDSYVVPCETRQRRFFALEVDDQHCGRQTKELKGYYDSILSVPAVAFAHVLYHHDLTNFNPREIHSTDFERDQKIRSFAPMMAWWHDCLQEKHIDGVTVDVPDSVNTSGFGEMTVKDSVYDSFTGFCLRNRRGNTYHVTAKNEFWRLLDSWTQTIDRQQRQIRLTQPEIKRQVLDSTNGLKTWVRVVAIPSLEECREAWKERVVFDEGWKFQE